MGNKKYKKKKNKTIYTEH